MEAVRAHLHACRREGLLLEPTRLASEARYAAGNGTGEPHLGQWRQHLRVMTAIPQLLRPYPDQERETVEREAVFLTERCQKLRGAIVVLDSRHGHLPRERGPLPSCKHCAIDLFPCRA